MHMEGDSMVYIPLYPVQRFPANKQVMKNSKSYMRFSSLSVFWFEYLISINASALKGFKMQLENKVKTVNSDLDQTEANK